MNKYKIKKSKKLDICGNIIFKSNGNINLHIIIKNIDYFLEGNRRYKNNKPYWELLSENDIVGEIFINFYQTYIGYFTIDDILYRFRSARPEKIVIRKG